MKIIIFNLAKTLSAFTLTLPQGNLGLFPGFGSFQNFPTTNNNQTVQQFTQFQSQVQNLIPQQRNEAANSATMTSIGDYGCWCYFGTNNGYVGAGSGAPIDEIDYLCKQLHDNYKCAAFDDSSCDPYATSYTVDSDWINFLETENLTGSDIRASCATANAGNTCAEYACSIEGWFVYQRKSLTINSDYQHPTFDSSASCISANGGGGGSRGDKDCCGSYPERRTFWNGSKACCTETTVYNTVTKQCCASGIIKNVGETC